MHTKKHVVKTYFLALIALGVFVSPGNARADTIQDYYTSPDVTSTFPISSDGTGGYSAGSYAIDFWAFGIGSTTPQRCASGSSFNTSFGATFWWNNCPSWWKSAVGSTTVAYVIQDSSGHGIYQGTAGGNDWTAYMPADGDLSTHVISISSPVSGEATSSPVFVKFTYQEGTPAPANGYELAFVNTTTGASKTVQGYFSGGGTVGTYTFSTSTTLTDSSGTWSLVVSLIDGSPDVPSAPVAYLDHSDKRYFGMGYNDNYQSVELGPAYATYATSSCSLSWSLDFSVSDCVGYLLTPSPRLYESYNGLAGQMKDRFPFVYVSQMGEVRNELLTATQTATTTVGVDIPWFGGTTKELTFISKEMIEAVPFAGTIKTILGYILWILLAEALYLRVTRIHDKTSVV